MYPFSMVYNNYIMNNNNNNNDSMSLYMYDDSFAQFCSSTGTVAYT